MKREHLIILLKTILMWGALFLAVWFITGCKTQVVTVPEYHTVYHTDTVNTRDSVLIKVREVTKGDTVYKDSIVYRDRWRDRVELKVVHDSIPYPVEITRELRVRSGYDRFCSCFFWVVIVLAILYIAWWVFKKFYLRK